MSSSSRGGVGDVPGGVSGQPQPQTASAERRMAKYKEERRRQLASQIANRLSSAQSSSSSDENEDKSEKIAKYRKHRWNSFEFCFWRDFNLDWLKA